MWRRMTSGKFTVAIAVGAGVFACAVIFSAILPVNAQAVCASDVPHALASARRAVSSNDRSQDHAALACMVDAVAALDARLTGLSNGSLPFEGQIYAPKGVGMTKPPTREAR